VLAARVPDPGSARLCSPQGRLLERRLHIPYRGCERTVRRAVTTRATTEQARPPPPPPTERRAAEVDAMRASCDASADDHTVRSKQTPQAAGWLLLLPGWLGCWAAGLLLAACGGAGWLLPPRPAGRLPAAAIQWLQRRTPLASLTGKRQAGLPNGQAIQSLQPLCLPNGPTGRPCASLGGRCLLGPLVSPPCRRSPSSCD
jgi:hypothetical protein